MQVIAVPQLWFTVKVTVETPPQAEGVPGLLLVKTALQPPLKLVKPSHAAYFASICACVWQAASTVVAGQFNTITGASATVKVAEQVLVSGAQVLVYVKVTVFEPPQASGAPVLLLVKAPLQPPLAETEASQFA